ncbi:MULTISPECIES: DUF1800 domain-containing protein [unclassified Undibacterium]|uniref:DUF1800 domain-containing protein n=1 Tax=unclassified Undibacterium TaxID=2630295 RepID=UPI002AC9C246|nr:MULTISPECIES: DUF1800 domain-containing protein [unclassified Undibacterium]MEB0137788.1 DUF1800 domain-containing protein [Undibacterium sp. CCC2.1]MEB0171021.1 DUF1800 domain-containing protein [Undibacterium sp. CCC1.1]MEB0175066.1 DUF1800 domain-containing protein [Undibacterium sp. CCC3.4]MEB0215156.1 DUF1800 domain-containing protein [Undibacterium sp. 5I2]WPX44870.1 DUF1800 domain-containing protein [Undibacterium sp. CCC3.4]
METPSPAVLTEAVPPSVQTESAAIAAALLLSACGGSAPGSAADSTAGTAPVTPVTPVTPPVTSAPPVPVSDIAAARFLAQASVGGSRSLMARVQALGYAGWIDEQIALPASGTRWDWLMTKSYNVATNIFTQNGFDAVTWYKLINSPDVLKQRVVHALSEIIVVGIDGLVGAGWQAFSAAHFLDILETYAFGNYRQLLEAVSTSTAMGQYLTFRGNSKYNASTGALPDENYAREIMQLFSIGLLKLNLDGTPVLANGVQQETYTLTDITGLARIFTGWDFDLSLSKTDTPDFLKRPMSQVASRHETAASTFLGSTVPAGLNGAQSLSAALDILFAHPNVAPFISRQLIQRLVTSNPSAAYVGRVTAVFLNDGSGVKGNLAAVVKALLLDDEARNSSNLSNPQFGKLREPILRLLAWARAYALKSVSDTWAVGNTSDPASRLGQSPLRSSSVFNFFRPGYVPPNSAIATASLVAPEFQITNESTVIGYVNYMQRLVSLGNSDLVPDYSSLLPLADTPAALLAEINLVLAAGQLSAATLAALVTAVSTLASGTDAKRSNRIYAALTLVLAAPEFIVLK